MILLLLYGSAKADCYMHNPRGSNNKLHEQSNTVTNNQRLFDSQNNNDAGYQAGDACIPNCLNNNNQYQITYPGAGEGVMQYYEGSYLYVEWTNQHGSMISRLQNQFVLDYMCDDGIYSDDIRDGVTTNTIPTTPTANLNTYGQHENQLWYRLCQTRQRNKGLFTADQNLQGQTAQFTRQNAAGTRRGLECPEERDYYPYWHPTPWRDIWVCTSMPTMCQYYKDNSQNVVDRGNCTIPDYNNQKECVYNGGQWNFAGKWNMPPPECTICPATRNNHNGNAKGSLNAPSYMWKIPEGIHKDGAKCILRIRYNITTNDLQPDTWNIFSDKNGANSPVKTNPVNDFVGLGANVSGPIRLNINTAQFGRTFEDRSHVFQIRKRPSGLNCGLSTSCNIYNLNVRGRRGNIVQVYPAVEYDFVPPDLTVTKSDYLHIQWTGADSNDQGNDGNGKQGTDRSNLVIMPDLGKNFPTSFNPLTVSNTYAHFTNNIAKIAELAFLNQTGCDPTDTNTQSNTFCPLLNRAPAYYNFGLIQPENTGTFKLLNTRNNAFSNREIKTTLTVTNDVATIAGSSAIAVVGMSVLSAAGFLLFRKFKKPTGEEYKTVKLKEAESDGESVAGDDEKPKTLVDKYPFLAPLVEWYAWNQQRVLFWVFFGCCQAGSWMYGYFMNPPSDKYPAPYFPIAKGFGKMLDFNLCFILVPVMRNFLSFLRTTPAADKLPLDDNIEIHKWTAYTIILASIGHIGAHFADFVWFENYMAQPFYWNALANIAGPTGFVVTGMMLLMYSSAFLQRKIYKVFGRRYDGYRTFLSIHKLWIPVYVILWFHGSQFWQFSVFPLMFMAIEKYIQSRRTKVDVKVIEAKMTGKDVLNVKMQLLKGRKKFRYKAGQYLFLCCPDINETEYHPFTITSAPEDPYFSCHIRCRQDMDWTYRLRQVTGFAPENKDDINLGSKTTVMSEDNLEQESNLLLRVDGPYGSASEEVFDYDTVILVGAGIGVTPFISILKSISLKIKSGVQENSIKIYFYWICRDQAEFDSFKDFFDEIINIKELQNNLELNMYVTGEMNLKNVRQAAYNQFSGRPNWNRIFKEKAVKHKGTSIGVFLCGPAPIAAQLAAASKQHSTKRSKTLHKGDDTGRTVFKFHKENF
ncbi:ferric reductase NAD binding domain-containing protein [Gorgonomyces haynaldii]|nr:ferric reductase NAD binding domain-containing protein [Gorgonomyces haynaldii]